ncbi:MAG TPA: serine hydrolase domain-containing protein [Flavobacterium sp.]|jgi:D-alanyl-D-alanine carboxypeptidase
MKKIFKITVILVLAISLTYCNKNDDELTVDACTVSAGVNPSHPKAAAFQAVLDEYVQKGLPGLVLYVKTSQGIWTGSAGKASIETGELIRPCNLIYSQSVAKTFTAVSVMKLVEEGRISLDASISTYLPAAICNRITNANQATVRQLLNHTSGIKNYYNEPEYLSELANNRARGMTTQKNLEYVYDKPASFPVGTDFSYSNTNYILLAMIIDQVTGTSHADFFTQRIFRPLGLTDMYYKNELRTSIPAGVSNSYGDLTGNGELENVSDIESRRLLTSDYGEAGILGMASNYAKFIETLFKGNLISPSSKAAMTTWIRMENPLSLDLYYGLGLLKRNTPHGFGIGHIGDGVGTAIDMFYFPDSDVTIIMGTNKGLTTLEGARLYREELWNKIVRVALDR